VKRIPAEFLNVDLDLKSSVDLSPLAKAWSKRVIPIHTGKWGRRYWLRLAVMGQPKTPAEAIAGFSRLVAQLRGPARVVWTRAAKELDIGVQAGFERRSAEWVLDPKVVRAVARMGAALRITVYSPMLIMQVRTGRPRGG
jgi:hypothetical protein